VRLAIINQTCEIGHNELDRWD